MNNKIKVGIISAATAMAIISVIVMPGYFLASDSHQATVQHIELQHLQRGPPLMPLSMWGSQVTNLNQAISATGLRASLPTYLPVGLDLDSIRVRTDSIAKFITVIYLPQNMTSQEIDTFDKVIDNGVAVIYSQEQTKPSLNQTKWMHDFVNAAPTARQMDLINGHPTIIVNAQKSEVVVFHIGGDKVDIVSVKYNSSELKKIAQTILP